MDPLLRFEVGEDLKSNTAYGDTTVFFRNIRGVRVSGNLGEKLAFSSKFREEQSFFPGYQRDFVRQYGVIPGTGRVKPFKGTGFDAGMASGYLAYAPFDDLRIEVGHGKHFFGDGYRSLFLSDNAFHYPYLAFRSDWSQDRVQYTHLFGSLQRLKRLPKGEAPESLFQRKAGSFHFVDLRIAPGLFLNFFEGMIWQRWSPEKGTEPFQPAFFNPVIFLNTGLKGFDDTDNALAGMGLRWALSERFTFYGQALLDDPKANNWAYQGGFKAREWPFEGSYVQVEGNRAAPGVYTHEKPLQSYSHFSQPLAHPVGTGFLETVGIFSQRFDRIYFKTRVIFAKKAKKGGISPVLGERDHLGERRTGFRKVEVGYVLNPITNLRFALSFLDRERIMGSVGEGTRYLGFSLKTGLSNHYYDF